ncbi:hypothetical protein H4R24_004077 [Coemansia sp. RSA 988]|nr:hypothetical protein H4R24_004077 [Coemansia sp. RSA 988]
MIIAFLIDTSVSMDQEFTTVELVRGRREEQHKPEERLFGGEKGRVNRRQQRQRQQRGQRRTRLSCAKSIVEQIVDNRRGYEHDRYILATYNSTGMGSIRTGLKDSRGQLLSELRRIEARDRFGGGMALTALFDKLALMRCAYDMDTYGYGRYPGLSESAHILWLTDGASVVTCNGVQNKLNLPVNSTPWVEAYVEPFRWDQRMLLVLLHEQGDSDLCAGKRHSSESTLLPMCSVMGGAVHHVGTMLQAQRFIEAYAPIRAAPGQGRAQGSAMLSAGVLVNFERIDDNPANPGNSDMRVLLHASPSGITNGPLPSPVDAPGGNYGNSAGMNALIGGHLGYFPIPEAFWPEAISPPRSQQGAQGQSGWQLQRRSAHPTLGYSQASTEWAVPAQFPFDKYQIDVGSNVAQKLLAAAQAAQLSHEGQGGKGAAKPVCWPVFVNGSYTTPKNSGFPFGILRPNSARTAVNLFVLPYNFTALWKILAKLDVQAQAQSSARGAVAMSPAWRREFEEYLQHTPGYYAIPLKRAFNLYGIPHGVFPKSFGQSPGMRSITQYSLRSHGIARKEWDRHHADPTPPKSSADAAADLQQALLHFDPASDISHLVTNAFDVSRAHCLATLGAMRRVFVRELMSNQSAYFRANAVIPPSPKLARSGSEIDMDIDDMPSISLRVPTTPPVASMEYSLFGHAQRSKDISPRHLPLQMSPNGGRSPPGFSDTQSLELGLEHSPLGGIVDVASEDDRDSRHSVPIRIMGEYGPAMHRVRAAEARDPFLDERMAQQQRRNMFGNPYRRPLREPRGPTNNVLARSPDLSAKLGLSRGNVLRVTTPTTSNGSTNGQSRSDADDEAAVGLEMESEAEVNEHAIDNMFEELPATGEGNSGRSTGSDNGIGGKYWWMQRRNVPRRRSISTPWRKNDESWNVNPWAVAVPDSDMSMDLGALAYTSDAVVLNTDTAQVISTTSGPCTPTLSQKPTSSSIASQPPLSVGDVSGAANNSQVRLPGLGIAVVESPVEDAAESMGDDASMDVDEAAALPSPTDPPPPPPTVDDVVETPAPPVLETPAPLVLETPAHRMSETAPSPRRKVNVAEERAWLLKHIKADPARYNENAIVERLAELESSPAVGRPQLKVIVTAAVAAAKAMRRKQLVTRLEQSLSGA